MILSLATEKMLHSRGESEKSRFFIRRSFHQRRVVSLCLSSWLSISAATKVEQPGYICAFAVRAMTGRASFTFMRMSNLKVFVAACCCIGGLMNTPAATAVQFKVLNFFLHDRLLAAVDPSAFIVLPPLAGITVPINPDQSFFGAAAVFDDSMTVTPDLNSLEIGRGRGFYIFDQNSSSIPAIEFSWTAEFSQASGYTPGSTLTFKGFDRTVDSVREIAIVGGTRDFRLARGWAMITTYSLTEIGNAILNITAYFQYGF